MYSERNKAMELEFAGNIIELNVGILSAIFHYRWAYPGIHTACTPLNPFSVSVSSLSWSKGQLQEIQVSCSTASNVLFVQFSGHDFPKD